MKQKLPIIIFAVLAVYFLNKYSLGYKSIKKERIVFNQAKDMHGANVDVLRDIDINNDSIQDTVELVQNYYSEWLDSSNVIYLIDVYKIINIGITKTNIDYKFFVKSELISRSKKAFSMIVIEQEENNNKDIKGWKVIGFHNGKFFQRTPTVFEFLSYWLINQFPAVPVGAGG
jgi:hypothetical protein